MSFEIAQIFGGDLLRKVKSGTLTQLYMIDGTAQTECRVLRRLLTNPGDYIWHLDYGGGLGRFVGKLFRPGEIEGIIRVQMSLENTVLQSPAPNIVITQILNGIAVYIGWVDAVSGKRATLDFTL